ncbi:MAG: phosphate acyltransferase PlsX [Clostridiales Family XIII bacterium]|nr:phosphate acyltransferase PlsX [Clostridiales Family XIII bacterium]
MRIILDGMGGDNAPKEIVEGAAITSKLTPHEICIVGDEEIIKRELSNHEHETKNISIVHASEVITNEDKPVQAIRTKKDSSLVKGLMLVKNGEGDMLLSAGNSGAIMTGSLLLLGRLGPIGRPALGALYPMIGKDSIGLLLDAGANTEYKSRDLLNFAAMGSVYAEKVLGIGSPAVGLVNVGTEPGKGPQAHKEAYQMLEKSKGLGINFIGNIEGRDVPSGIADVVVCDGMTGNVLLKLTEGLGFGILGLMSQYFTSSARAKIGALLLKPQLREMKKVFNYNAYGGAPILGVTHPVIKIHGASTHGAVRSGILKALPFVENDVIAAITEEIQKLSEINAED